MRADRDRRGAQALVRAGRDGLLLHDALHEVGQRVVERRIRQSHALLQLAQLRQLGRVGDQRDALLLVELLAVGVDLPALRRRVGLLEHPACVLRQLDRGHRALEDLVLALEGVRQRRGVLQAPALGELELAGDRVGHCSTILVELQAAAGAHRDRVGVPEPVRDVEGVRAGLAEQAQRNRRVEHPVVRLLLVGIAGARTPAGLLVELRARADRIAQRAGLRERVRQLVDRVRAREQSRLEDALRPARRERDRARVSQRRGDRRLAVDVLPGRQRVEHDLAVQVRRRGDDPGARVRRAGEQLLVRLEARHLARAALGRRDARLEHVAHGRDLEPLDLRELAQDRPALLAAADQRDLEPAGAWRGLERGQELGRERQRRGAGRQAQEFSAVRFAHVRPSRNRAR